MADDSRDELLSKFNALIAGANVDELHDLGRLLADGFAPKLSRPRLEELFVYRIRVELNNSQPLIWRQLELRSDLMLDEVHQLLQTAFGWADRHLYVFSIGGDPLDRASEKFLCPFDVGENTSEGGPASEVRLDETLQDTGDELHYVYDYGDNWDLTLTIVGITSAGPATQAAVCSDGGRAGPPEDCGGLRDGESLATVLEDPAEFDVDEINNALVNAAAFGNAAGSVVPDRLLTLLKAAADRQTEVDPAARLRILRQTAPSPGVHAEAVLAPITDVLNHVGEGLKLTAAGYLKPADVRAVAEYLPAMGDWIFTIYREVDTYPVQFFREALQELGLVRKYKGELRCTRAGTTGRTNPTALWTHLADRLSSPKKRAFDHDATLLVLFFAATGGPVNLHQVGVILRANGWRVEGGQMDLAVREAAGAAIEVFRNFDGFVWGSDGIRVGEAARLIARAAIAAAVAGRG